MSKECVLRMHYKLQKEQNIFPFLESGRHKTYRKANPDSNQIFCKKKTLHLCLKMNQNEYAQRVKVIRDFLTVTGDLLLNIAQVL